MQFVIEPGIFALFPRLTIAVAVARGLDNTADYPSVNKAWAAAWAGAQAAQVYGNAQSHPRVKPWRDAFRTLGVNRDFRSSIEAIVRRALKGGEPFRINPLVDFYNGISLRHFVPAGGFDLAQVRGPLDLRLTREGDQFTALDDPTTLPVPPGEVSYGDGITILTRHFVWRQSREAMITPATRDVFLVSEVLGDVGQGVAEAVLADLGEGLVVHFGVTPQLFLLDSQQSSIEF